MFKKIEIFIVSFSMDKVIFAPLLMWIGLDTDESVESRIQSMQTCKQNSLCALKHKDVMQADAMHHAKPLWEVKKASICESEKNIMQQTNEWMRRSPTWHERESTGQLHESRRRALEHRPVRTGDALSVHPRGHRPAGAALSVHGDGGRGGRGRGRWLCGGAVGASSG